ncbi:uncharacterized protein PHACADRAFT_250634 [Phanerochaete carnosa HHB-10118-sp]|uniref:Cytochrome c oxidase assembly factor 3 n=1 Tax=Phanerochaete carnosa (strain HHB-10118-sp) TaxID=650164 RepID=K5W7F8_PHACS|nr:uncharacterized protein PHACADRAFT_250634 [Phanerochaete carnosa HHB-10118-sp]EKM59863.1 hypothetical protein PHACADRAFT_250634 [Phanerochaete carnosa HHB-10118-sp]
MADQYVDKKTVNSSYRPKSNQMSPGLKRARQPFFLRNTITGVVLASFAVGVWAYSIGAVKQDDFTDVDEEARALARSGASAVQAAVTDAEKKAVERTEAAAPGTGVAPPVEPAGGVIATSATPIPVASAQLTRPRGVLASLVHDRHPNLLDPTTKTFIWGAPSVDRIGRLGEPSPISQRK